MINPFWAWARRQPGIDQKVSTGARAGLRTVWASILVLSFPPSQEPTHDSRPYRRKMRNTMNEQEHGSTGSCPKRSPAETQPSGMGPPRSFPAWRPVRSRLVDTLLSLRFPNSLFVLLRLWGPFHGRVDLFTWGSSGSPRGSFQQ